MIIKPDNFDGNTGYGDKLVRLWCDATVAIVVDDWISIKANDTANPFGAQGETYEAADDGNVGAAFDTIGVAKEALASGTGFITVQVKGRTTSNVDSGAAVAIGDPLCIGSTKGRAIENVLDANTTANRRTIAVCRSTPSGNSATVDIIPHPKFA